MKRLLLAVSGLSPQILTESLYALACQEPSFIPDEVHLLTTAEGASRAKLELLSRDPGWFHRLRQEYGLPYIHFPESNIHLLRDDTGRPLEDIRTPKDNEHAADSITDKVRELTQDANTCLHVSIAGGRKTMGFYAGYALSLYGRAQDDMSHVLVSSPYEFLPDFFYPSREERIIHDRDGRPVDAAKAQVWLSRIPFVRLRHAIPDSLRSGKARFSEVVRAASEAFTETPQLTLYRRDQMVETPTSLFRLPARLFAFLLWMAEDRKHGGQGFARPTSGVAEPEYARNYLEIYRKLSGANERTLDALEQGMESSFFDQAKSRLNKALDNHLPLSARHYQIVSKGKRGHARFGLWRLDPEQITIKRSPP